MAFVDGQGCGSMSMSPQAGVQGGSGMRRLVDGQGGSRMRHQFEVETWNQGCICLLSAMVVLVSDMGDFLSSCLLWRGERILRTCGW